MPALSTSLFVSSVKPAISAYAVLKASSSRWNQIVFFYSSAIKKTKALILDLRGNGGGVFTDATYKMLNEGVIRDPQGGFLVSEKLHEGVGMQSPGKNPFTGKTFVLTDGISFSTAADVAAVLHNAKKAIFIGEETGRAYEGNTSGLNAQVNSKNSGFRVRIHMYEYWNAVLATKKGRGTLPDHVV